MPDTKKQIGDYVETLNPLGYINNREITNLPGQYLVKGSKNCRIINQEKVASTKRYTLLGAAKTKNKGHRSSYDWKTNTGHRRSLRMNTDGDLEVWYDSAWRTLKTFAYNTRAEFCTWWDATELIDLLLFVIGDDTVNAWSGAITEIASSTPNSLTKKGYLSGTTFAFNDNGSDPDTITDSANGFITAGFAAGDQITISGSNDNDGTYIVRGVAAGTLTLDPDDELSDETAGATVIVKWTEGGTWAESRFFTSGTRKVVVDGVEYAYTGGETTGTLTGLTGADAISADDICMQAVRASEPATLDGFKLDRISMLYNYVFYGSTKSRIVNISKSTDYDDFTMTTPRRTGEGFELTLDNALTAFIPDEDEMYCSAGEDDFYKVSFQLSATTTGDENVVIKKLKTATGQAARSQAAVINIKNAVAFLSFDRTIDTLGRVENIEGGPESLPISDSIKDDLAAYDLTDAHGIYHDRQIFIALPAEGVLLIYDHQNGYWQPPYTAPIGRLALIDEEGTGEVALCGHSSVSNETYKLFDGYNDNGAPWECVMAFGYENFGSRFTPKIFDEAASELYISENTVVTNQIVYDYKGATAVREFEIDGADTAIRFKPATEGGALGSAPLGHIPLGSLGEEEEDMAKVRAVDTTTPLDFFERQRVFFSTSDDLRFEVLAFGENVELSDNIPAYLKR